MCSLQQMLLLLTFFYLASAQSEVQSKVCGDADFDISPLIKVQHWEISITDCAFFSSGACTLYVSFCDEVPLSFCNNNELGPTSVCVTDGTTGYSLGKYTDNPFLHIPDKLIASFDNGSHSQCTNKAAIKTNITFDCNPYADWNSVQDNDASVFFGGVIVDFEDHCSVSITVHYDRVCLEAVCEAKDHDISPLTGRDHWEFAVDPEQCEIFFGKNENCTLYLSFCEDMQDVPRCPNSTVCLSNGTVNYSFGQYNKYANPFYQLVNQTLWVIFENGRNYSQCPYDASSTILLLDCASGQDWEYSGSKGDMVFLLVSIMPALDGCVVSILMNYSGGCAASPSNNYNSSNEDAGVVWIGLGLIIGLVMTVALYLSINIAKRKYGCPEMLSQSSFWRAFRISVSERVGFIADLITCGWCSRATGRAPLPKYNKF